MLSKLMLGDIFYNILVKSGNCFKSICNLFKRKSEYRYTPVHLMRTEIEIETLLDESDDIPQARFIPQHPKKTRQDVLETLNAIDSCGNVTSFDIANNCTYKWQELNNCCLSVGLLPPFILFNFILLFISSEAAITHSRPFSVNSLYPPPFKQSL